jgi:hypothetical protein
MRLPIFINSMVSCGAGRGSASLANHWAAKGWEKFVFLGAGRVLENVSFVYFGCWDKHFLRSGYSFLDIDDILSSWGFTIGSVKDSELLPIQRDSIFPRCINLFTFKDMEKCVVRMGLRA